MAAIRKPKTIRIKLKRIIYVVLITSVSGYIWLLKHSIGFVDYKDDIEQLTNSNNNSRSDSSSSTHGVVTKDTINESNIEIRDESESKTEIAYAVSITGCTSTLADGAAILKHSIHLQSYPQNQKSKYTYKMIAFVHPDAQRCVEPLQKLNYEIMIKETPINVSDIQGKFLREHVYKTGCCGDKEFLKLYAYTLVEYDVVVHLDLDTLIVQPLDDLFDSMRLSGSEKAESDSRIAVMYNDPIPDKVEAYFTRDYNMANLGKEHVNIQGGFLVVKPNLDYFEEYKRAILKGDFKPGAGWEGKYGGYFGAQQIQGLCAYFFDGLHPGTAVELNRCVYNQMNDNPKKNGVCLDGKPTCEDCRKQDFDQVKTIHFTLCQKPWICPLFELSDPLCASFHKKWFEIRKDLDEKLGIYAISDESSDVHYDGFLGYCSGGGEKNYQKFAIDKL